VANADAGTSEDVTYQTKWALALTLIDRTLEWHVLDRQRQ